MNQQLGIIQFVNYFLNFGVQIFAGQFLGQCLEYSGIIFEAY